MPVSNPRKLIENRVDAIRDYHKNCGIERAQLDVSGGIDSAVMLGLLARALGPGNITAVYSAINSSHDSRDRAREVAKVFGVKLCEIEVTDAYDLIVQESLDALMGAGYDGDETGARMENDPLIKGSLRSTLRAPLGRFMNRLTGGGIRHGTGNECEDRWLRFYQKGGDGEVDTNPIAMLSKGEVFQLARALEVPVSILSATPSHDLHEGQSTSHDEVELFQTTGVPWRYSIVNPTTGLYTYVGTIERMSRFMDEHASEPGWADDGEFSFPGMFKDAINKHLDIDWPVVVELAKPFFQGFEYEQIVTFLKSAQAIEFATRHKMNPNCPTLGIRDELVRKGIITNILPQLEI